MRGSCQQFCCCYFCGILIGIVLVSSILFGYTLDSLGKFDTTESSFKQVLSFIIRVVIFIVKMVFLGVIVYIQFSLMRQNQESLNRERQNLEKKYDLTTYKAIHNQLRNRLLFSFCSSAVFILVINYIEYPQWMRNIIIPVLVSFVLGSMMQTSSKYLTEFINFCTVLVCYIFYQETFYYLKQLFWYVVNLLATHGQPNGVEASLR